MEFIVKLPHPLAKEANAAGLLGQRAIEKLLREAIERRSQIDSFFATVERLRAAQRGADPS